MIDGLLDYVLHDLSEEREAIVDEHLFGCDACTGEVTRLQDLVRAVEGLVRASAVGFAVTPRLEAKLVEVGLITRTYVVRPSETVLCGVDAKDRLVLTRLVSSELRGATRVDVLVDGNTMLDVPFDPGGSVSFVAAGDVLRRMPSMQLSFRVVVDRRPVGEYVLDHTAFAG